MQVVVDRKAVSIALHRVAALVVFCCRATALLVVDDEHRCIDVLLAMHVTIRCSVMVNSGVVLLELLFSWFVLVGRSMVMSRHVRMSLIDMLVTRVPQAPLHRISPDLLSPRSTRVMHNLIRLLFVHSHL